MQTNTFLYNEINGIIQEMIYLMLNTKQKTRILIFLFLKHSYK